MLRLIGKTLGIIPVEAPLARFHILAKIWLFSHIIICILENTHWPLVLITIQLSGAAELRPVEAAYGRNVLERFVMFRLLTEAPVLSRYATLSQQKLTLTL